ncbi:putative ABC transport system permease protein [Pedobacter sp. UYEF25]
MFKNYFKIACRNLKRNSTFSILNIAGLAVGIACAAFIFLWVEYYVKFNDNISNLSNIYNVKNTQTYGADTYTFSATPFQAKQTLKTDFPQVEDASRFNDVKSTISLDHKSISQAGAFVDGSFLKMFNLKIITGNLSTALSDISQVAISQSLARRFFRTENAIGKTLKIDTNLYKVSAIYADVPENNSFYNVDFLLPYEVFYAQNKQGDAWGNNWTNTWVQLAPNTDLQSLNKKVSMLVKKHNAESNNVLSLYPMSRMALYGQFVNGRETNKGRIEYIKMFSSVALIILLIACINFMNLSTARSGKRVKEIGMRKVLGSPKSMLIARFLLESLMIAYLATMVATLIIACLLSSFNTLIGVDLHLNILEPLHLLFIVGVGLICGLLAGSYPAVYLSSFKLGNALKNQIYGGGRATGFIRQILVVIQFTVSAVIIIAVVLIYQQIQHTKSRNLGFNKNNVLYTDLSAVQKNNLPSLKQELLATGVVESASVGSNSPLSMYFNGGGYTWNGKTDVEDLLITTVQTDDDYFKTFDISLADGRGFSSSVETDSMNVIINQAFAKKMGKEGVVGGQLRRGGVQAPMTIIGITKDFVYNDMSANIPAPLIFYHFPKYANTVFLKLKPTQNTETVLASITSVFKKFDPSTSLDYHFIDQDFESKFKQQKFVGVLAGIFGGLTIFISCLGLFGLSAFVAEQKRKEIGIRKVLGASVSSITQLLSKEFLKLVFIACFIAFPIAYWFMHNWLLDYEYRININWYVFVFTAAVALLIAFGTVSFQAIKAALANPIKSLRTE